MCKPEDWIRMAQRAGLTGWSLADRELRVILEDEIDHPDGLAGAEALRLAFDSNPGRMTDWAWMQDGARGVFPLQDGTARRLELMRGPVCNRTLYGVARLIEGSQGRRQFEQDLLATLMGALREGGRGFMMLVGVRDLDRVREGLGQLVTESLFDDVERRLVHACFPQPVFRISGTVFAILGRCDEFDEHVRAARILAETFDAPFEAAGLLQRLMGRAGIAVFPEDDGNIEDLLHSCSLALSSALRSREHVVQRAEAGRVEEMREQSMLAAELAEGIAGRQFRFDLQPIIDLENGRIVSAEALARWLHPVLGEIPPSRFVPLAERQEILIDATIVMLRRMAREVDPPSLPDMRIAINIAPGDFNQRTLTRLADTIQKENLLPFDRLTLEITETGVMQQDVRETFALANALRNQNVCLAIDDFGTGYSSFGNLSALPLDILKIDRSLAQDVHLQPQKARMLAAIANMAGPLGMKTVVEGLECEEEVKAVREIGCNRVQGYVYSRPLSSARFLEFCRAGSV